MRTTSARREERKKKPNCQRKMKNNLQTYYIKTHLENHKMCDDFVKIQNYRTHTKNKNAECWFANKIQKTINCLLAIIAALLCGWSYRL